MCALNSSAFEYERNFQAIRDNLEKSSNPTKTLFKLTNFDNKFKEELNKIFYRNTIPNKPENKFTRIKNLPSRQDVYYYSNY